METNTKTDDARAVIIEHLINSDLKNFIKYKETEAIYPGRVDRDITLTGRVTKKSQNDLEEFIENLYDKLAEKCGNEFATEFNNNVTIEVGPCEGEKFQGIECFDEDGKKVQVKHESGQILMIDFWATWCKYCQEPMQENVDLMTKNSNFQDNNISIIGLSCDENASKWKEHLVQKNWKSIPQYVKTGLRKELGIKAIPCVAIINKEGVISYFGHPMNINLEETLIALSKNESIKFPDENPNPWWSEKDLESKLAIVTQSNCIIKDAGVISGDFCVITKFKLDSQSYQLKPVKTLPTFYGKVTQFEYDTMKNSAINLQTTYNFNSFDYNIYLVEFLTDEDF